MNGIGKNIVFYKRAVVLALLLLCRVPVFAQQQELNSGWKCAAVSSVNRTGEEISVTTFPLTKWMSAVVPGTVLTSLLFNKLVPDPFYGMNNEQIPDIYTVGREHYTYWFVKDFDEKLAEGDKLWLQFRGVNNSCDVYVNGHKVNEQQYKSMYLRQQYDITPYIAKTGKNRLAVIVYPPDPVGNPNGGQGGDGTIAHNITNQYVAGWDWIQPVRDRNTGIWDKVFIKKTGQVTVANTHVVTTVPGVRQVSGDQAPATLAVSTEVSNEGSNEVTGIVQYELADTILSVEVKLAAHTKQNVVFPAFVLNDPRLWWPNGYGRQNMYRMTVRFLVSGRQLSDEEDISFGVREIKATWNSHTQSREIAVNGQRIFIKGGNWITTDAMLRASKDRYDAEIRYHRDMNLNLVRVWGGGITERPEFYDACDKYGLLVMQDLWMTGDCNGRWDDPFKAEDTTARRNYPDDHSLFLASAAGQVLMLRNHPSLALWCGGNEIRPPADILKQLKDSVIKKLDGTRFFFPYSNDDSMSYHSHDGPYNLQTVRYFWEHRSYPFNSEIGSVGIGDYESLERFMPADHMVVPARDTVSGNWMVDTMWRYHKYAAYDSSVEKYGHPVDVRDFAKKTQLVNYNQYRALMEGFTAHMWDWYTGVIVWKTQNPWTAMVGQMYDTYLDPNAGLFGMQEGAKPLHIMYDPVYRNVRIANCYDRKINKVRMWVRYYQMSGYEVELAGKYVQLPAQSCDEYFTFNSAFKFLTKDEGLFLSVGITDSFDNLIDENFYWLPDAKGEYSGLQELPKAGVTVTARLLDKGKAEVVITNPPGNPVAFFNRTSLIDAKTKKRILPAFADNNYVSVVSGQQRAIRIDFTPVQGVVPAIAVEGWNVDKQIIELKNQLK